MKKYTLILISLFLAYSSYAQSLGENCSNPIVLNHNLEKDEAAHIKSTNEYWYSFVASTNYVKFMTFDYWSTVDVYLYSGDCSGLTLITQSSSEQLSFNTLSTNTTYYIKVVGVSNGNNVSVNLFNVEQSSLLPSQICPTSAPNCNLVSNGDFSNNNFDPTMYDINADENAFEENHVFNWTYLTGTPDLYTNQAPHFSFVRLGAFLPVAPHTQQSESIITCLNLEEGVDYIYTLATRVINTGDNPTLIFNACGNEWDLLQDPNLTFPTPETQDIITIEYTGTTWNTYTNFFTADATTSRMLVYGSSEGLERIFFIDDLQIVPIYYPDIITCEPTVVIEQACANEILNMPNVSGFQWSSNLENVFIANENTLTPTINAINNPVITFTLSLNDGTEKHVTFTVTDLLTTLTDSEEFICPGGNLTLEVPAGSSNYLWSSSETNTTNSINVTQPGDYTCNVVESSTCQAEKTFHVLPYVLNIDAEVEEGVDCTYEDFYIKVVNLFATPGYTNYNWSFEVYDYEDQLMNINIGEFTSENTGHFTNPNEASYVEITLIANAPGGCTITSTTTYYVDQAFDGTEPNFANIILNQDWINKNYTFFTDVVFENGIHNIYNSHIEFAHGYGIVIGGPNNKLNINNSELTGYFCGDRLWNGIMAIGNPNASHTSANQPTIYLTGGSKVSRAEAAITSRGGAIIYSKGVLFENNENGIVYKDYKDFSMDNSLIIDNKFEVNSESQILSNFHPVSGISLHRIEGLNIFQNNQFYNTDLTYGIQDRGTGIYADDVVFLDIYGSNRFEGLSRAIDAIKIKFMTLEDNLFKNNFQGSSIIESYSYIARKNEYDDQTLMPTQGAFQMRLTGCLAPVVELNEFKNGVLGLYYFKLNHGDFFQAYKNTFSGFDMYSSANLNGHPTCILFDGDQGEIIEDEGAEAKCNSFTDYHYAIAVQNGSIKGRQGGESPTDHRAPAGNDFEETTYFNNMNDGRFHIATGINTGYVYYHHSNPITFIQPYYSVGVGPLLGTPEMYDPNTNTGSCPTINPISSAASAQTKVMSLQSDISTEEELLNTKVDQGNTELLLSDISLANDASYTALAQEIQSIDSYLSDEAAQEFMDKTCNQPVAKTIALVSNSPLPLAVQSKIADLDLSEDLKAYIQAQQVGLSKREKHEQKIHQLRLDKYKLLRRAIEMVGKDSLNTLYSPVVDLLLDQDDWDQKEMAYHMLKHSPRKDEAPALLLELQQDISSFETEEQYHLEDYLEMLALENQLDSLSDTLRVVEITNHQGLLEGIKTSEYKKGRVAAELLLKEAGLFEEIEFIQLPNPNSEDRSTEQKNSNIVKPVNFSSLKDLIEVYPNPVDEVLTVQYLMFNGQKAKAISIYDINGKLLLSQKIHKSMDILNINVSDLTSGTYIIAFGKEGVSNNSTKFIIK